MHQNTSRPVCWICEFCVAVLQNLTWTCISNNCTVIWTANLLSKSYLQMEFINKKLKSFAGPQSLFQKRNDKVEMMVKSYYENSLFLACKKNSYSDGEEIIKKSLLIFAHNVSAKNLKNMVNTIASSQNAVLCHT